MSIIDWIHNNIDCQPYDYSKIMSRSSTDKYYLTYSLSERNRDKCRDKLREGGNIAAVFNVKRRGVFPETFLGYPVVNGDEHDLRFLDPKGVVIGLSAKGDSLRNKNGFVIYRGDRDLDRPEDNLLLRDPIQTPSRKLKFNQYRATISFSKRNIQRRLNGYMKSGKPLLSSPQSNPKLAKGNKHKYLTYGLTLAPAKENGLMNFCAHASEGCLNSCLHTSGNMISMKGKINARLERSWAFVLEREWFFDKLKKELISGHNKCKRDGMKMALRLNVLSDLPWENIKC